MMEKVTGSVREVFMLNGARSVKLLGLIVGVVLLNIIVLSPGLLGVEIGE